MNPNELTALQKMALSSISNLKNERKLVNPGRYNVAFTVSVNGQLDVSPDEHYVPTSSVPVIPTIALALKKMGVQRNHFLSILKEAMTEVIVADGSFDQALIKEVGLDKFEEEFRALMGNLPKKSRAGKVKAQLSAVLKSE